MALTVSGTTFTATPRVIPSSDGDTVYIEGVGNVYLTTTGGGTLTSPADFDATNAILLQKWCYPDLLNILNAWAVALGGIDARAGNTRVAAIHLKMLLDAILNAPRLQSGLSLAETPFTS